MVHCIGTIQTNKEESKSQMNDLINHSHQQTPPTLPSDCTVVPGDISLLWKPSHDHSLWLRQLVCTLLEFGGVSDEVLSLVRPVCVVKHSFCEHVFLLTVHDILLHGGDFMRNRLSKQVS